MATRKKAREPVSPVAATETGRFLVLMENLQSQVQALAEGQVALKHGLIEMEGRLRDDLRSEASVLRAAIVQNSTDIRGLDARLSRVEQRLDRVEQRLDQVEQRLGRVEVRLDVMATRAEVTALADRVTALERAS